MPLSRLENFLKNVTGNVIYVNPEELDATDDISNRGNSRARPFKTIQRALIEAARFSYQVGDNNDRFDKTTVLVSPGVHYIDNRPGLQINTSGSLTDVNGTAATIDQLSIGTSSSKTTFYPDGDTFTGESSSDLGDVFAYVYFNEAVNVTGTPQLQLNQATALGSNFGTIMDFNSSVSVLSEGIMAFSLPASEDTRTSNVTNNTLGINSDDSISLNSGTIQKLVDDDKIRMESGTTALDDTDEQDSFILLDGTDSSSRDLGGFLTGEGGVGMAADLTLTADADATMTVS